MRHDRYEERIHVYMYYLAYDATKIVQKGADYPQLYCFSGFVELFLLALAARAAPGVRQVFKPGSWRYSLFGIPYFRVVNIPARAYHLIHRLNCFGLIETAIRI